MSYKKKTELTASNRRRAEEFFGRVREIFERKFDGFPASVEDADGLPNDPNNAGEITPEPVLDPSGYLPVDIPSIPPCPTPDGTLLNCAAGEWEFAFVDSHPSGWGGDFKHVVVWEAEDIQSNSVPPFDDPSHEYLNTTAGWPYAREGVYSIASTGGYMVNDYAGEIWDEDGYDTHIPDTLNSTIYYGGAVYNNTLHNYLKEPYLPWSIYFEFRPDDIISQIPSLLSGSRDQAVTFGFDSLTKEVVYDPPFSHGETEHYHTIPLQGNSFTIVLRGVSQPGYNAQRIELGRGGGATSVSYNVAWTVGQTYCVLIQIGESVTQAKLWEKGSPVPGSWTLTTGSSTLTNFVPGISVVNEHLDWQPADTPEGGSIAFFGFRANPFDLSNPVVPFGGQLCTETFTRNVSGSWGISEQNGETWSSNANVSVDGDDGVIDGTASFGGGQTYAPFTMSLPVELTWDMRWDSIPTITTNSRSGFFINDDHSTSVGPAFLFYPTTGGSIGGRVYQTDGVGPNSYTTSVSSYAAGNTIHCRVRAESDMLYAKAWAGTNEPEGWDAEIPSTNFTPIFLTGYSNHTTSSEGYHVYFDNLEFVEGFLCNAVGCYALPPDFGYLLDVYIDGFVVPSTAYTVYGSQLIFHIAVTGTVSIRYVSA